MKKVIAISIVFFMTSIAHAEDIWKTVSAMDPTQPGGVVAYVGTLNSEDLEKMESGKELPEFIQIKHLTVIEQTGSIKKVSDFPWGGGKFVAGNDIYVNSQNILSIQSINESFEKQLSDLHK